MSATAFKRDLDDPKTILDFVEIGIDIGRDAVRLAEEPVGRTAPARQAKIVAPDAVAFDPGKTGGRDVPIIGDERLRFRHVRGDDQRSQMQPRGIDMPEDQNRPDDYAATFRLFHDICSYGPVSVIST